MFLIQSSVGAQAALTGRIRLLTPAAWTGPHISELANRKQSTFTRVSRSRISQRLLYVFQKFSITVRMFYFNDRILKIWMDVYASVLHKDIWILNVTSRFLQASRRFGEHLLHLNYNNATSFWDWGALLPPGCLSRPKVSQVQELHDRRDSYRPSESQGIKSHWRPFKIRSTCPLVRQTIPQPLRWVPWPFSQTIFWDPARAIP